MLSNFERTGREIDVPELTAELVAVPSINPGGDERAAAELIRTWCDRFGFPAPRLVGSEERPNLVVEVRFGPGGRNLALCGHLDTKPVGEGDWETDPLRAVVVGDELRGRGVADMKGAIAAMVAATAEARRHLDQGAVTLVFCADEEYGARHGAKVFTGEDVAGIDAMVIGEPGGIHHDWDRLHLGSRGICNFDIEITTRQAHSGLKDAFGLVSATEVAARVVVALSDDFTPTHPEGGPAPTINPGAVIEGGISYGVVPGRAVVSSECRLVAGMEKDTFISEVRQLVERIVPDGAEATVVMQDWIPATAVDPAEPVVGSAHRALEAVTGSVPPDDFFPATTDATWFAALGLPVLPALGPGLLSHAHAPNEAVSLAALRQAEEIYLRLIEDFCREPS
ncbi:MAG TPA: M20 family metallopeptidase [Acidimicrobiia bacterium]